MSDSFVVVIVKWFCVGLLLVHGDALLQPRSESDRNRGESGAEFL